MIWKRQATLEQLNRLGEGNMVGLLDIRFETVYRRYAGGHHAGG
jgi:1,4-dihydroxy-2-naphthoyl-CoA hydrolase